MFFFSEGREGKDIASAMNITFAFHVAAARTELAGTHSTTNRSTIYATSDNRTTSQPPVVSCALSPQPRRNYSISRTCSCVSPRSSSYVSDKTKSSSEVENTEDVPRWDMFWQMDREVI